MPHKTMIPSDRNNKNKNSNHQENKKEAINNGKIWRSSNHHVSMAQTRQMPRYREGQTPPPAVTMPKPTPNLITQPLILTRSDLTRWVQEDFCESEFTKAWKEECLDKAVEKEMEAYNPKD
jgi:hypothetical protein